MKIAIYGGSFNPPHVGHLAVIQQATLSFDRVIVIPSAISPHKPTPVGTPTPEQRLAMTRCMVGDLADVSDIEIFSGEICYTIDTLTILKKQYPFEDFFLLMGTDMFLSFTTWRRYRDIASLATIVILCRESGQSDMIKAKQATYTSLFPITCYFMEHTPVAVSSTQVREDLRRGDGHKWLTPAVYSYIQHHKLYQVIE